MFIKEGIRKLPVWNVYPPSWSAIAQLVASKSRPHRESGRRRKSGGWG